MDQFVKKRPIIITVKSHRKDPDLVAVSQQEKTPDIIQCVYCDGSTFNNGKKFACGGIGVYFGPDDPKNISEPFTHSIPTNQKTELYALARTMKTLAQIMEDNTESNYIFHIYTDSEYTINCLEKWMPKWMANEWTKWNGKQVKNIDLLKMLSELYYPNRKHYKLHHVMSHTGDQSPHSLGNQQADHLAVMGSRQHPNFRG